MLDKLSEFCEPVIGLLWEQPDLANELQQKGHEVYLIPEYKVSPQYNAVRGKIDFWYRKFRVKTPSVNIQKEYLSQFKKTTSYDHRKKVKQALLNLRLRMQPGYIDTLLAKEQSLIRQQPSFEEYQHWINELQINSLFTVTPFLNEVDLMARILRESGKKIIASIHSFDNVTKRGWASTFFDHYVVWNKYNQQELERIQPSLKKNNSITIAGAAQFDFHFNEKYCWTKEEWLHRLNIPGDKKIILYAGGPAALLPDEPQYLQHLKDAFDNNKISKDNIVLFRCHPLDKKERWLKYIGDSQHIYFDEAPHGEKKLDQVNVVDDDIKNLMSTLKYSDIHINVVSTISVDGSAFNKPQIGPYYDTISTRKEKLFRRMYYQEHYQPIIKTGVVNLAYTKDEYISLINKALVNPEKFNKNSKSCLEEIITYTDGQSTNRAVATIKSFFQ
jgi:hypothetical protein